MKNIKTGERAFDLEERTVTFSEDCIKLCKEVNRDIVTIPLIKQFIRSATSIGANYCEADDAESKEDFHHKIGICKKESKETMYWLRLLSNSIESEALKDKCRALWQESKELSMIFAKIALNTV